MHAAVPPVEITDQADAIGIGRPDREVHAGRRADADAMRAKLLERAMVRPFAEQMQIEIGEDAAIAIRIVDLDTVIAGIGDLQPVVGQRVCRQGGFETPGGALARHRDDRTGASRHHAEADRARGRLDRAHQKAAVLGGMRAEHGERITVGAGG